MRQSELPLYRGWFCYIYADADVFAYLRELDGLDQAFLIVLNFGTQSKMTDLSAVPELPQQLRVRMSTNRANDGKLLQKSHIQTEAGEGLVIEYSSHARFNPNHLDECFISEKACYLKVVGLLYTC